MLKNKDDACIETKTSQNFFIPNMSRGLELLDSYDPTQTCKIKLSQVEYPLHEVEEFTEINKVLSALETKLFQIKEQLKSEIENENQVRQWEAQKQEIIKSMRMQLQQEKERTKRKILEKIGVVEKELQRIGNRKKIEKKKIRKQICEEVEEFRVETDLTLKKLKKNRNQKFEKLKTQNKKIGKNIKQLQKMNEERRNIAMGRIEEIRKLYMMKIKDQQQKRVQKQAILSELLQKTCLKAQTNL